MRRSLFGRCFATLFAFWFAFSLAEPATLHSCPMHGAGADAPNAHAHGAVSHHSSATEHGSPNGDHAAKHCTCLGSCCASSGTVALPGAGASVETAPIHTIERHAFAPRERVITAAPFFLPYANGPPRLAYLA